MLKLAELCHQRDNHFVDVDFDPREANFVYVYAMATAFGVHNIAGSRRNDVERVRKRRCTGPILVQIQINHPTRHTKCSNALS